jgi:hypothetical protein
MKQINLMVCVLAMLATHAHAQITLQKVEGTGTKKFAIGSTIRVKLPAPTDSPNCACYFSYKGTLVGATKDSVSLRLSEEEHRYTDEKGISRRAKTEYYNTKSNVATTVPIGSALSISKVRNHKRSQRFGGSLMFLSAVHALAIAPFLPEKSRRTSDIVSLATFSLGLTMAIWPSSKTYTLRNRFEQRRPLWKIVQ